MLNKKICAGIICVVFAGIAAATEVIDYVAPEPMKLNIVVEQESNNSVVYKVSPTFGTANAVNDEVGVNTGDTITLYPDRDGYQLISYQGEAAKLYASGVITFYGIKSERSSQTYKIVSTDTSPVMYLFNESSSKKPM